MRYLVGFLFLAACSHSPPRPEPIRGTAPAASASATPEPAQTCEAGDDAIASSSDCLQDDAACYQLADGSWCTGGRPHHPSW
jgi:hypothetical protein